MANSVNLSLQSGYKKSIDLLRKELNGPTGSNVVVKFDGSLEVMVRRGDGYIVEFKNKKGTVKIDEKESGYNFMGGDERNLEEAAIKSAFNALGAAAKGDDCWEDLRIVCLVVSEAARSAVVYRACLMLLNPQGPKAQVKDFNGLTKNYQHTRDANNITKFRALDTVDYEICASRKAKTAITSSLTILRGKFPGVAP